MTFHPDETAGSIHVINDFEFADETAREAATGFVAGDVGKVAKQTDNSSYWILTTTAPTWMSITGGGVDEAPIDGNQYARKDADWELVTAGGFMAQFDANNALYPSTDPAVASSRNAHPIIAFDDTTAESVVFNSSVASGYGGEDINVDIDWVAETATTGGVTWGVEFEANAPGGNDIDSDSFAAQQTGTSTTNATSGIITRTTITLTQAQADAIAANDSFRLRVERVTGDGGDTMSDDAEIIKVSVRV